jgi:hypothetical protein
MKLTHGYAHSLQDIFLVMSLPERGSLLVEALCYKPKVGGFGHRRGYSMLSVYLILPATLGPRFYSACNRNDFQKLIKKF